MRVFSTLTKAAAAAGVLFAATSAHAITVVGEAVDAVGSNTVVGAAALENKPALGGTSIGYFIPFAGAACTYGVGGCGLSSDNGNSDTGPLLTMILRFSPVNASQNGTLQINFEDLDVGAADEGGASDSTSFLESFQLFDSTGADLSGLQTDLTGLISGNQDLQTLSLLINAANIAGDPMFLQLVFRAMTDNGSDLGQNTEEFLRATFTQEDLPEIPLPAAFPLFLAGLAGMGFASRKKKKAA